MKQPGRNIRGLLLCAALVLLLAAGAITSGQAETPKPGDLCPYCGIGTWRAFSHGPTEHLLECSYSGCEYTSYGGDKYIVENHYGGQTCGPIAYCEVCGNVITDHEQYKAKSIANNALTKFGKYMCWDCAHNAAEQEASDD